MATYEEYKERFKDMSDEQLIATFNKDMGNPGWTGSRASFHAAMSDEFKLRGLEKPGNKADLRERQ
jgi:hypothetical protein